MTRLHRSLVVPAVVGAFLVSIVPPASAGVLHGLEVRSFNGRSGHVVTSQVRMGRNGNFGLVCDAGSSAGGSRRAVHTIDVPTGHPIVDVTIRGDDVSASHDLHFRLRMTCQPYLEGALPVTTTLDQGATSGSDGHYMVVLDGDGYAPANATCAYFLESRFADEGAACAGAQLDMTRIRIRTYDPDVIFRDAFEP